MKILSEPIGQCARCETAFLRTDSAFRICPDCHDPVSSLRTRMERATCPEAITGCWLWTGTAVGREGKEYGRVAWEGEQKMATHAAWFLAHGEWPTLFVCHRCDTPSCVNPDHLFLGTRKENMADMVGKGRHAGLCGSGIGNSKLTEDLVARILQMVSAGDRTNRAIAAEFGVTPTTIGLIAKRKIWRHVSGPTKE